MRLTALAGWLRPKPVRDWTWLARLRPRTAGLLAGVLVGAVGAAAAVILLRADRANELDRAQRNLTAISVPAADLVERGLRTLDLMVSLAIEEFARGERDLEGVDGWLTRQAHRIRQLDALDRLIIVDANGIVQFSQRPEGIGLDVGDRDYFRHHRSDPTSGMRISGPVYSRLSPHEQIVPLSWALRDGAGQFAGVISVVANWRLYAQAFSGLVSGPDQTVALVNDPGDLLALDSTHWPYSDAAPSRPPFVRDQPATKSNVRWQNIEGYMVTQAAIPGLGLSVLAGEPLAGILQPWSRRLQVAVALLLVIAVGAGWLAGQLHHRVRSLHAAVGTARAAQARAELGEHVKAQFLAAMSHEIRTPMTGVLGMADLLAAERLSPRQRSYVQAIQTSGKHLLNVINDVLDFSRLGAGSLTLEQLDFELADTIEQVRSIMSPLAIERGLKLKIEISEDVPPALFGDPARLRQILVNLIANGLKFTPRGQVVVSVGLSYPPSGETAVRFEVRDSGIGIPRERLATLFQPFVQLDSSTARQYGGSGLGLAICRELVKLQNGRIGVESELGRGSMFWFELPFTTGRIRPVGRAAATPAPTATPPRRVLVAEDVVVNQDLLRAGLSQAGHEVVLVGNGAEAVERAARERFDAVLMDVQMPVMDGIEATRRIRALPAPAGSVPILALTANVMDEERERCLQAGMDRVLGKPIAWDELFAALAALEPHAEPELRRAIAGLDGPLLNLEVIEAAAGQLPAEVYGRLLQHGLQELEEGCGRLWAARGEPEQLKREAHRLRGTAGTFGLARVFVLAGYIEDHGADNLDGLVAELETTTAATRTALAGFLGTQ